MNITHVIVHDDEQVRGIIQRALELADECEHPVISPRVVFEQACHLLGQRATIAAPPQPVDLGAFKLKQGFGA